MPLEADFLELMTQTVKLSAPNPTDAYGHNSYASPTLMKCHIEYKQRQFTQQGGQIEVSSGRAFLAGILAPLTDRYAIDVPDLASPTGYRRANILAVQTLYDEAGPHHQVVWFGEHS